LRKILEDKSLLITGGTGSLGSAIVRRIATGEYGEPRTVAIFSRDELKQSLMAAKYKHKDYMKFIIGDVRDYNAVHNVLWSIDYIIHTAAMKQVGSCDKYPLEAILTNVMGMVNLLNAIKLSRNHVECVVDIASDKGADPLNIYGLTKSLQEQSLIKSNYAYPGMRFVCVRYGNVMMSRGSVIPVWQDQIKRGQPITITEPKMTRFLISLDQAVDVLFTAIIKGHPGDIYIPRSLPATTIGDLASIISNGSSSPFVYIGKQPGEKWHETLITGEEATRTLIRGNYYVITDNIKGKPVLEKEYISRDYVLPLDKIRAMLIKQGIIH